MKIEIDESTTDVEFQDLVPGDPFYVGDYLYMKLELISQDGCNAVALGTGYVFLFQPRHGVVRANVKVVSCEGSTPA